MKSLIDSLFHYFVVNGVIWALIRSDHHPNKELLLTDAGELMFEQEENESFFSPVGHSTLSVDWLTNHQLHPASCQLPSVSNVFFNLKYHNYVTY